MLAMRRTAPIRKGSHWHKPSPRICLIQDISEWIQEMTKDATDGLPDDTKMTRKELEAICRAIEYSRERRKP
jgi:hypothetical protein